MANRLENFGLEMWKEDEESIRNFIMYNAKEGKPITGYYDAPYFFHPMGSVEFWVKTEQDEEGHLNIVGFDSHGGNRCIWEMEHTGIDLTPEDASKMDHIAMFKKDAPEQNGFVPIDVITADVLPSMMEGDKMAMQMIALPLEINYYADVDAFEAAQPEDKDGKKWMIASGSLIPVSFLFNHSTERYEQGKDYESDRYVQFTATVKKIYNGIYEMEGKEYRTYIRCYADTVFGELEFSHTLNQVPEELQENIKVGAVISGTCILCGDVAIRGYENGVVKDFDHDLRLLRYSMGKGDPERLAKVLAPDVVYETDTSGKRYHGPREIIERFHYIHENREQEYQTYLATISTLDEPELEYPVGTRCIVLQDRESQHCESIAFINVNEDGMITRIKVSTDGRYHFKIDSAEEE